jgi:hypothetical protein
MDSQALALRSWQLVTLGLALEFAVGSAYLTLVALMGQRWRRDLLMVVPPLAGFVWVARVAGGMRAQTLYWSSYLRFLALHYPTSRYPELITQTREDYTRAVDAAARLGWTAVVITECAIVLSLVLTRRWMSPRRDVAASAQAPEPDEVGNELEIVIEPLGVEHTDASGV